MAVNFADYKNIWVFAEQRHGKLMNVALELIGEGHKLSREIKFAEDLVDYFTVRQEYASYNTVSQLILGCWDFVKSVPATYSALSMIAKLNPVANIPANRYHLIENIFEASEDWDF